MIEFMQFVGVTITIVWIMCGLLPSKDYLDTDNTPPYSPWPFLWWKDK